MTPIKSVSFARIVAFIAPFIDFYSIAGIVIVLLTHGMETSFFRFAQENINSRKLVATSSVSVMIVSFLFILLSLFFRHPIAVFFRTPDQINYLVMLILILGIDGICAMPFVILRKENKSKKYTIIKSINAFTNFILIIFLIVIFPNYTLNFFGLNISYNSKFGIGYVFLSNLIASIITLLFLLKEFRKINVKYFDFTLWKDLLKYSVPIMIAGLSGVINESLDRQFLKYLLPANKNIEQMAIYGSVYKLATVIIIFRQAYLLGVEPFFFSHSKNKNSIITYSNLMTWFIIINTIVFLFLCVNLNWISQIYIRNPQYYVGLTIIPIILMASIFLGIYLNLSIWYKLSDKTIFGAYMSLIGAIITVLINYFFIPKYGYWASAWATFVAYFSMMIISYFLGRKFYPIPYKVKTNLLYLSLSIIFSMISIYIFNENILVGNVFFILFLLIVFFKQKLYSLIKI